MNYGTRISFETGDPDFFNNMKEEKLERAFGGKWRIEHNNYEIRGDQFKGTLSYLRLEMIMGTKEQPAKNDCYHRALPDEPTFTLLARDPPDISVEDMKEINRKWA